MNLIKYRYWYFVISLLVIIPGVLALIFWGLPLGIDFTGGSLLEVQFKSGNPPSFDQVSKIYSDISTSTMNLSNPEIQPLGSDSLSIRSREMDDATKAKVVAALKSQYGGGQDVVIQNFNQVTASVGAQVTRAAVIAVIMASVAILLYIWFAFRKVNNPFRFGVAAIIATIHDTLVVLGMGALLGHFLKWQVDSLFLTALLTVIGFSVHDDIVVFDRIRENSNIYRRVNFETVVNHSIVQTLDRSINTQLTVMITLLALALFGGETIHHFVVILLIGVFSGTYSSIFNASPILVVWENKEWRNWFHRKPKDATA
ncbi:MAG: protein translocase subunit SecF [Anaerolineales bacterium]|jgi:preprotein translocase subunit SecF